MTNIKPLIKLFDPPLVLQEGDTVTFEFKCDVSIDLVLEKITLKINDHIVPESPN